MGYMCDFCGDQRSMIFCRSDAACLCLSCDRNVHSANSLSRRHSRTLLCERCNSQPAFVRCEEEKVSFCQNCDWMDHGTSASTHKRQTIDCYSGCPSASELSSIWSFVLDFPSTQKLTCEEETGLRSISENNTENHDAPEKKSDSIKGKDGQSINKSNVWIGSSSRSGYSSLPQSLSQHAGSANAALPTLVRPGCCEDVDLYGDFDMDEADLNLENYEELFGVALTHSETLFENGGIDSLFGVEALSAANSSSHAAVATEGTSVGRADVQPACSNAASTESMMSTRTEPILCFRSRQGHSNLSFSGITGNSTGGDHQDCCASPVTLMEEPPSYPPGPESSYQSASRNDAVLRYKEKKKTRKFEKRVRYASRKARADVRTRVKGRFVKAGEIYNYDPLSKTRSY